MSFLVKFFVLTLLYEKFSIVLCENGDNFTYLIAGGYRPTQHTLTKYAVSLRFFEPKPFFGYAHFCGGSILSPKVILTAAHCLWDKRVNKSKSSEHVHVVAGIQNRLIRTPHTQIMDVERLIVHSNYKPIGTADIGMLHLKSKLKLDGIHAQAIAITDTEPQSGQICTVIGWGVLFEGGPFAADIMYGDLVILKRNSCINEYTKIGVLCLSGKADHGDPGPSTTSGDSGGPLICDGKQYGIVSFSEGIEGTTSGYADVWHFREWITDKMKENKLSSSPAQVPNHAASYRFPVTIQIPVIFLSLLYVWIM